MKAAKKKRQNEFACGSILQQEKSFRWSFWKWTIEGNRHMPDFFTMPINAGGLFLRSLSLASGCVLALSGCGNGRLGELQMKPIYAELSGVYSVGGVRAKSFQTSMLRRFVRCALAATPTDLH